MKKLNFDKYCVPLNEWHAAAFAVTGACAVSAPHYLGIFTLNLFGAVCGYNKVKANQTSVAISRKWSFFSLSAAATSLSWAAYNDPIASILGGAVLNLVAATRAGLIWHFKPKKITQQFISGAAMVAGTLGWAVVNHYAGFSPVAAFSWIGIMSGCLADFTNNIQWRNLWIKTGNSSQFLYNAIKLQPGRMTGNAAEVKALYDGKGYLFYPSILPLPFSKNTRESVRARIAAEGGYRRALGSHLQAIYPMDDLSRIRQGVRAEARKGFPAARTNARNGFPGVRRGAKKGLIAFRNGAKESLGRAGRSARAGFPHLRTRVAHKTSFLQAYVR